MINMKKQKKYSDFGGWKIEKWQEKPKVKVALKRRLWPFCVVVKGSVDLTVRLGGVIGDNKDGLYWLLAADKNETYLLVANGRDLQGFKAVCRNVFI